MGKQKNRLTATKRRNHFARIFDMGAHMNRLGETSRMVVFPSPYDARGRQEMRICARSRVGRFLTYPVPPDQLQGRRISSYPTPPDHLPYSAHNQVQGRQAFSYPVVLPYTRRENSTKSHSRCQISSRVASFSATLEYYPIPGRQIPPSQAAAARWALG